MFEISPDQQEKLLTDGFVSLPNAVPSDLIDRWRELADRFEAEALDVTQFRADPSAPGAGGAFDEAFA